MNHTQSQELDVAIDDLVQLAFQTLTKSPIRTELVHNAVGDLGRPKHHAFLQKRLVWFMNSYLGVAEELESGDITLAEAKASYLKTVNFFKTSVSNLVEKELDGRDGNTFQEKDDILTKELLAKYARVKSSMQSQINSRGLFFDFAPVLPMVAFDRAKLKAQGIPSANMQGYSVLEGQYILGISLAKVEKQVAAEISELVEDTSSKEAKARLKVLRSPQGLDLAFTDMVDTFMSKHRDLVLVSDRPVAWWEARWYWFAKPKTLSAIRASTFGSKFDVHGWGFPFQSTAQNKKAIPRQGV